MDFGELLTTQLSLQPASAWNVAALAIYKQLKKMCLFFMEYGAIGRGQGTCHSAVCGLLESSVSPSLRDFPARRK